MKTIVVIGGGFFGLYLSEFLSKQNYNVIVCEREQDFMKRASYVNQARVHNGYHYPRSILTALRSRISFPRFVSEFNECIDDEFEKVYLIGKSLSKVTSNQFQKFCDRIGAPCEYDRTLLNGLANPSQIESAFLTKEYAFNSTILKETMIERVTEAGVTLYNNTDVTSISKEGDKFKVKIRNILSDCKDEIYAEQVFNCTYSGINKINVNSGYDVVPLKHEMTEMCLVEVPDEVKNKGITIMCGPFFSVMPFPDQGLHSFSHVRYTPHYEWEDGRLLKYTDAYHKYKNDERHSSWEYMVKDAARYIPILQECEYKKSIWDVKTILPRSESDDSRPILFLPNYQVKGYHCIMGGKIDNVYDAVESIISQGIIR